MSSQFARLRGALDRVGTTTPGTIVGVFAEDLTAIMNHYVEVVREAAELKAARAQPAQAGQVLTRDDIVDAWMAVMHIDHATQRQDAFARAIEQAVLAKRVPQWLPISTAPKGQRVMVWVADKEASENIAFAKVWFHADGTLGGGAEGFNGKWDLTHWTPLPPPPGIVGEKGGA